MYNTNDFLTVEENSLLKQINTIKDRIDAIELVKALAIRVDSYFVKQLDTETSTRLNSDKLFYDFCSLIPMSDSSRGSKSYGDEQTDDYYQWITFLIYPEVVLEVELHSIHDLDNDKYEYSLNTKTSVIPFDYKPTYAKSDRGNVVDLNSIIKAINEKYGINGYSTEQDADKSKRERK